MSIKFFQGLSTGTCTFIAILLGSFFFQISRYIRFNLIKKEEKEIIKKIEERNLKNRERNKEITELINNLEKKKETIRDIKPKSSSFNSHSDNPPSASTNILSFDNTQVLREDESKRSSIIDEQNQLYDLMVKEEEKKERLKKHVSEFILY